MLYDESPVEEQSRRLARAYGLGHVVRQARAGRTVGGSTSAVAADLGIPSITAEAGQNGILDRASIDRHLTGLASVTRLLGIDRRPSPPAAAPTIAPAEHDGWVWLRTTYGRLVGTRRGGRHRRGHRRPARHGHRPARRRPGRDPRARARRPALRHQQPGRHRRRPADGPGPHRTARSSRPNERECRSISRKPGCNRFCIPFGRSPREALPHAVVRHELAGCSRPICSTTTGSSCRSAPPNSTDTSRSARTRSWPSGWRSRRRSHWVYRCYRCCPSVSRRTSRRSRAA